MASSGNIENVVEISVKMLLTSVVFLVTSLFLKVLSGGSLELLTSGFGVLDLAELENLSYKLEIQTQPVTERLLEEKATRKETSDQWREVKKLSYIFFYSLSSVSLIYRLYRNVVNDIVVLCPS